MATGSRLPDCPYFEETCFAFRKMGNREKCSILSDTHFYGRTKCPFFKTMEQYQKDCARYPLKVMAYHEDEFDEASGTD